MSMSTTRGGTILESRPWPPPFLEMFCHALGCPDRLDVATGFQFLGDIVMRQLPKIVVRAVPWQPLGEVRADSSQREQGPASRR